MWNAISYLVLMLILLVRLVFHLKQIFGRQFLYSCVFLFLFCFKLIEFNIFLLCSCIDVLFIDHRHSNGGNGLQYLFHYWVVQLYSDESMWLGIELLFHSIAEHSSPLWIT